jgi:hypothetical protein
VTTVPDRSTDAAVLFVIVTTNRIAGPDTSPGVEATPLTASILVRAALTFETISAGWSMGDGAPRVADGAGAGTGADGVTLAEPSGVALALELVLGFGVEVEPAFVVDDPPEVAMITMTTATITTTAIAITMMRWRVKKPGFGVVSGSDIGNSAGIQKENERQPGRCRFTA